MSDKDWKENVKNNAVDTGFLCDWYINSVADDEWKESQVEELSNDFYCIPKEVIDGRLIK